MIARTELAVPKCIRFLASVQLPPFPESAATAASHTRVLFLPSCFSRSLPHSILSVPRICNGTLVCVGGITSSARRSEHRGEAKLTYDIAFFASVLILERNPHSRQPDRHSINQQQKCLHVAGTSKDRPPR
mgnify:CR=1 FL=1